MANLIVVGSDEERMMEIPDQYVFLLPQSDLVISQTDSDGEVKEQVVKVTKIEIPATIDEPNKLYTTGTPRLYVETPLKRAAFAKIAKERKDKPAKPEGPENPNPPVTKNK